MSRQRDKGTVVGKVPHDKCGSSDGLVLYEHQDGSVDGYCWACSTYEAAPEGRPTEQERRRMTPQTVSQFPIIQAIPLPVGTQYRGIDSGILQYFGVKLGLSPVNRAGVTHVYYPRTTNGELEAYKEREVASKKFSVHKKQRDGGNEFFGQTQAETARASTLYITEGEDDAMTLFKVLWDSQAGTQWEGSLKAVVSLPDGAASVQKVFAAQDTFLRKFESVVLVFDNDEPGREAVAAASKILPPGQMKYVELAKKDCCKMVETGLSGALMSSVLFQQLQYKPSSLVSVEDILDEACVPPTWGPSWPWQTLTNWTYGLRPKMIVGVAAGVGIGKSNFILQVIEHMAHCHNEGSGLFLLEQTPAQTVQHIASKIAKCDFTRPDIEVDTELLRSTIKGFAKHLTLYDHKGYKGWEDIKTAIRHAVLVDGRRIIIVDPITALVSQLSGSEANDTLNAMFSDIASMTQELDFDFIYGAHLNPPAKEAKPHEEGGRVKENQITGSRAMIKWSNYIIGLERNKQCEDPVERNTTTCRLLKDREYGRSGTFPIYYDSDTRDYYEVTRVSKDNTQAEETNRVRF